MNTKFKLVLALALIFLSVWSCKKTVNPNLQNDIEEKAELSATQEKILASSKLSFNVNFGVVKEIDVPINIGTDKVRGTNLANATCLDDISEIQLTYIGFKDEGPCANGGRYITLNWNILYPHNNQGCNNSPGYGLSLVLGANSFATFNSPFLATPKTAPLSLSQVYFDLDAQMPPPIGCLNYERVSSTINLTESEYNIINSFTFTMQVETDCPAFPLIQPASSLTDNLTQNIHSPYPYPIISDNTNGSNHQFLVTPVNILCIPAHAPTLGNSPLHKILYRLQGSNQDWWLASSATYPNSTTPFNVVVPSAGTYEIMYKYVQDASGTWSEYSPIMPVIVQ